MGKANREENRVGAHEHRDHAHTHEHEPDEGCGCGEHDHEHEHSDHEHTHEHENGEGCGCGDHDHAHEHSGHAHTHDHEHGMGCDCGHEHAEAGKRTYVLLGIGAALLAILMAGDNGIIAFPKAFTGLIELAAYLVPYFLIGGGVLLMAGRNILKGQVFDENFLMSIATVGAFAIGEYPEGVAVMLFYRVGEAFQDYAVGKSRRSITELMDIRPDYANLKTGDGSLKKVDPEAVKIGDIIVVKPGEKIPLDGTVVAGTSAVDTSALTGESVPTDVSAGSEVLSGSVASSGLIEVRVSKTFGESTVSKILNLVQHASGRKARIENFISKFAKIYTPAVVIGAAALAFIPPLFVPGAELGDWVGRALVFLVVSCPCALVISIPLSYFAGIGAASRRGILVKGAAYLDALAKVDTAVFDKTGTLTYGKFSVAEIIPAGDLSGEELLRIAAHAESNSNHPVALSVTERYEGTIDPARVSSLNELAGEGVTAEVDGRSVACGNARLMSTVGATLPPGATDSVTGTVIYVAIDGVYAGRIEAADEAKPSSATAIAELKSLGVHRMLMFTGDRPETAAKIGEELRIDEVAAGLLPADKFDRLEQLFAERDAAGRKGSVIFAGDGINDAPVLARADVGIAMGGIGSDAAIEAADAVIMTDEPAEIVSALRIAKKTKSIVMQNIVFALAVKGAILALGAVGIATMWMAVFGDVGVALLAVLNALRALRVISPR